jgi:uncharacterized membrane protein YgdD (TMEM256/DUF423 family)
VKPTEGEADRAVGFTYPQRSRFEEELVMGASFWLRIGAIWGFLAVAMGSFGAHGLRGRFESLGSAPGGLPAERLQASFQTATQYQMYCALAILAVGLMALAGRGGAALDAAGWLLLAGSLVFSGSLYVLCITGENWLGMITPIGGVAMLAGWIALAIAAGAVAKATGSDLGIP